MGQFNSTKFMLLLTALKRPRTQEEIVKYCGLAETTVRPWLKRLLKADLVKLSWRKRSNRVRGPVWIALYRLDPEGVSEARPRNLTRKEIIRRYDAKNRDIKVGKDEHGLIIQPFILQNLWTPTISAALEEKENA